MVVNATVIVSGKVVPNTYNSAPIKDADCIDGDAIVGMVVRTAVERASAQGYYMGDPNAYVRVEFKD